MRRQFEEKHTTDDEFVSSTFNKIWNMHAKKMEKLTSKRKKFIQNGWNESYFGLLLRVSFFAVSLLCHLFLVILRLFAAYYDYFMPTKLSCLLGDFWWLPVISCFSSICFMVRLFWPFLAIFSGFIFFISYDQLDFEKIFANSIQTTFERYNDDEIPIKI